ncbi:substrate-binding periplasmic protein [Maridesulfovibrio sp.]|uniref:substrate-binding periplasmic protein n=1 Tax=Maridesulfovibrio sp. TaxID=2795000 RepID=UPI003BA95182
MKIESVGYIVLNNKKGSGLQGKRGVFLKFRSWFLRCVWAAFMALLFFLFSMVVQFPYPAFAGGQLVIGIPMWGGERTNMPELECFLNEAYSRIGVDISFKYAPGLRLSRELSKGKIDGLGAMLASLVEEDANFAKVPVKMGTAQIFAVSIDNNLLIESAKDLQNYKVACIRGNADRFAKILGSDNWFYEVADLTQAFKMMSKRRVDVVLADQYTGKIGADFSNVEHVYFSPPLLSSTAHHYLSSVHSDLVPRLAKVFKDMFKDGSGQQCYGKYSHFIPKKYRKE